MANIKTLLVIPARYNSTRLAGKVLLDLEGKTVIERVYTQVKKSKRVDKVIIATDSEIVIESCKLFTEDVVLTPEYNSGTDRVNAISLKFPEYDNVINVQGDEPFIDPDLIDSLVKALETNEMLTVREVITKKSDLFAVNVVKLVLDNKENAMYFSRSAIPYHRDKYDFMVNQKTDFIDDDAQVYFKHVGVYAFKRELLNEYAKMETTKLENVEKLEQMRLLENGIKIKTIVSDKTTIGIDTKEDLKKAKEYIRMLKGQKC